jgi:hypothetical protein
VQAGPAISSDAWLAQSGDPIASKIARASSNAALAARRSRRRMRPRTRRLRARSIGIGSRSSAASALQRSFAAGDVALGSEQEAATVPAQRPPRASLLHNEPLTEPRTRSRAARRDRPASPRGTTGMPRERASRCSIPKLSRWTSSERSCVRRQRSAVPAAQHKRGVSPHAARRDRRIALAVSTLRHPWTSGPRRRSTARGAAATTPILRVAAVPRQYCRVPSPRTGFGEVANSQVFCRRSSAGRALHS